MLYCLQVVEAQGRIGAVRSLLYLAHGMYKPGMTGPTLTARARENVFLLLEAGVVGGLVELLGLELEQGRGVYEGTKENITIADNLNLRGTVQTSEILYMHVHVYACTCTCV